MPKLQDPQVEQEEADPVRQWMAFISAKTREVMSMLAQKNPDIGKAVNLLERISQDELRRIAYEARLKEILDRTSFISEAEERGMEKGLEKGVKKGMGKGMEKVARQMLSGGEDVEKIKRYTGLSQGEIEKLKVPGQETGN